MKNTKRDELPVEKFNDIGGAEFIKNYSKNNRKYVHVNYNLKSIIDDLETDPNHNMFAVDVDKTNYASLMAAYGSIKYGVKRSGYTDIIVRIYDHKIYLIKE